MKQLAWQDTLWLNANETTTILMKFDHLAPAAPPFTYGVTDLMLADGGCMEVICGSCVKLSE